MCRFRPGMVLRLLPALLVLAVAVAAVLVGQWWVFVGFGLAYLACRASSAVRR